MALEAPAPPRPPSPRVLGIDPGSRTTGWAIIERSSGRYRALAAGAIRTDPDAPMGERLLTIFQGLSAQLIAWSPTEAALEQIFSHRSATSALVLGQARGVALLSVAARGIPLYEYNASTIKKSVGGSGRAEKEQMTRMVAMLLGETLSPHDAADAAAIAITHYAHVGMARALGAR